MTKRPSFQFYPADWRNDPDLRLCSIPARGLWIEILCLMHEGDPYGTLTRAGLPMTDAMLARLVGESVADVTAWREELRVNGVYSVDGDIIFSRRMVRDERLRNTRAAGGHLGGEHGHKGAAHGKKGGRPKKQKPPSDENKKPPLGKAARGQSKPPPSSSSSSPSSSSSEEVSSQGATFEEGNTHGHARDAEDWA